MLISTCPMLELQRGVKTWCLAPDAQSLAGEGHMQAHYRRHAPRRLARQAYKAAKGRRCSEVLTWANGGLTAHTSHTGKGCSVWYCVLKRNWTATACSYFLVARVSDSSAHCLIQRGNISPRCEPALPAYPIVIQVSTEQKKKVAKDGHELDWFQKWGGYSLRICHGAKRWQNELYCRRYSPCGDA